MNIDVEKTLRQRQEQERCIICARRLDELDNGKIIPTIVTNHQLFGELFICEKHIRVQGKES